METIAELTGAEAGWVTTGAAAAMTLGAAACIASKDLPKMDALPDTAGMAAEIIVQRGHLQRVRPRLPAHCTGARIVEVGYPWIEGVGLTYEWQLEAAFSERTVAVGQLALADADGVPLGPAYADPPPPTACPVIAVDAAAELPAETSNLRRFVDEGAALVAYSGGKAIRGPQGSGVLAGPSAKPDRGPSASRPSTWTSTSRRGSRVSRQRAACSIMGSVAA